MGRKYIRKEPDVIAFADFETYHIKDLEADGLDVRVVGRTPRIFENGVNTGEIPQTSVKCACMVTDDLKTGERWEDSYECIEDFLIGLIERDVERCYFHNLRFDQSFIQWMFEMEGTIRLGDWQLTGIRNLMGRQGVLYSSVLTFVGPRDETSHRRVKRKVTLWDSLKVWNSDLRSIGNDFGCPKGNEALTVGVDDKVIEYCMQDCRIVEKAMLFYFKQVAEATGGKVKRGYMTAASTAYGLFKHWALTRMTEKTFEAYFPDVKEENGFPPWLREGYKGATPLLDQSIRGEILKDVSVFDVNSQHPFQMVTRPMPVGRPIPTDQKWLEEHVWHADGWVWCARVSLMATVKEGHRATFLLKHMQEGSTLAETIDPSWDTVITDVDLRLLERDYDIMYLKVNECVRFHTKTGLFKDFVMMWYNLKAEAGENKERALKAFCKLIINSFYGKFGTNPERIETEYVLEGDCLRVRELDETKTDSHPLYLPVAMWTTAYSRDWLSYAGGTVGWENVCYTDTDSIHCHRIDADEVERRLNGAGIGTSATVIGDYKHESDSAYGWYIRNKGYCHFDTDGRVTEIKMAGANRFDAIKTMNDVIGHDEIPAGRKIAFNIIGGKLIMEMETTITANDTQCMKTRVRMKGLSHEATMRVLEDGGLMYMV